MWRRLCPRSELQCRVTLECGQVFSWRQIQEEWVGVVDRCVVALREDQASQDIEFMCLNEPKDKDKISSLLESYFRTNDKLSALYASWMEPQDKFSPAFRLLPGLRLIRQDPLECLFSFICSSNNNISRVTQMLEKLRTNYGDFLLEHQGTSYHAFPTLEQLLEIKEADLRSLGFGYRAQYIVKSAKILHELGGPSYLDDLRQNPDAEQVQSALTQFSGVGRKVADCIALFSLEKLEAIPVDTHVWQIAIRDFKMKSHKSLTPAVYAQVGKLYQDRFTPYAGWAHSILFAAELNAFRPQSSPSKRKSTNKHSNATKKTKRQDNLKA